MKTRTKPLQPTKQPRLCRRQLRFLQPILRQHFAAARHLRQPVVAEPTFRPTPSPEVKRHELRMDLEITGKASDLGPAIFSRSRSQQTPTEALIASNSNKTMKQKAMISRSMSAWTLGVLLTVAGGMVGIAAPHNISLVPIGTHSIGIFNADGGVAEIVAHDPTFQRLFVVSAQLNLVTVLDIGDPTQPSRVGDISLSPFKPNSVAVRGGVIAVAAENAIKTAPGRVFLFDNNLQLLSDVEVGALPDMLTFSPNGRWLLIANEGEPDGYGVGSVDPEGSVSIIDLAGGAANVTQADVRTADFSGFTLAALKNAGVRVFGPGASPAQDLEPEYIAVSRDSRTAWVTLQENNSMAIIDIPAAVVTAVVGLGLKDHSLPGNGLDPSDRDSANLIQPWPVKGLYESDGIAAYMVGGNTFLVLANEGDAREWGPTTK